MFTFTTGLPRDPPTHATTTGVLPPHATNPARRYMRVSGSALLVLAVVLAVYALYVRGTMVSLTTQQRRPAFTNAAQVLARQQRLTAAAAASATAAVTADSVATTPAADVRLPAPSAAADARPAASGRRVGVTGFQMDFGDLGVVRVHIRPEWSKTSFEYAKGVAAARSDRSTVYRLEPGFLIQGSLVAQHGQSGRLGGAISGHHRLLGLHLKA